MHVRDAPQVGRNSDARALRPVSGDLYPASGQLALPDVSPTLASCVIDLSRRNNKQTRTAGKDARELGGKYKKLKIKIFREKPKENRRTLWEKELRERNSCLVL